MRKTVALGMTMIMTCALAACGNKNAADTSTPSPSQVSQEAEDSGAGGKEASAPSQEVIKLRYADTCADINPDGWGNAKFIEFGK
jgi:hypothetical protein